MIAFATALILSASDMVEVTHDGIRWNAEVVQALQNGTLPRAALDGHVVRALEAAARPVLLARRKALSNTSDKVRVAVRAAPDVAWAVVSRVILTLELAGADATEIELPSARPDEPSREQAKAAAAVDDAAVKMLMRHAKPDRPRTWAIWPTVWIELRGYSVYTHPTSLLAKVARRDRKRLAKVLWAIKRAFPDEPNLTVMAVPTTRFGDLLDVLSTGRSIGFSKLVARPGLFSVD